MRCIRPLLMALCLSIPTFAMAGEQASASAPTPPSGTSVPQGDERSLLMREARQQFAQLTEERNQLRAANQTLSARQGLLIAYGVAMTLLAAWLMMRALARPAAKTAVTDEPDTDLFPAGGTTATVRKNATITIRNGATQQAEVTGQVQTRRAFARSDSSSHNRRAATTSIVRKQANPSANVVIAPELEAARPVNPPTAPATQSRAQTGTTTHRATVRVEQTSDRLAPVEVAVKPGTAPLHRPTGRAPGA